MRDAREHRGYVLVMTLAALVLAATVMTTLALAAIDHTREARRACDELQRRWGVSSCRQAILPNAEHILAYHEAQFHQPTPSLRTSVRLGRFNFALVIADEQAKANVNAVITAAPDRTIAEDRIRRALASNGISTSVRLRPAIAAVATTQRISGMGQVIDASNPARLVQFPELLTCWGDGRINLSRANAPAMALAAPTLLQTDIQRLLKVRSDPATISQMQPGGAVEQFLTAAHVDPGRASGLTLTSTCHSVWIITDDGRRVWYDLAVRDEANPDQPQVRCFSW